jgi:microcystin-dependent protein
LGLYFAFWQVYWGDFLHENIFLKNVIFIWWCKNEYSYLSHQFIFNLFLSMLDTPLMATVSIFAGTFAPLGWYDCSGQQLAISSNQALYSLIGVTYGGNGSTTFNLPDLRGRAVVGQGQGPNLQNYTLGQVGGVPTVTLTVAQLPTHNHPLTGSFGLQVSKGLGTHDIPNAGDYLGTVVESGSFNANAYVASNAIGTPVALGGFSGTGGGIGMAGGGLAHENMQPYLALRYVIAYQGAYPMRP